MVSTIMEDRISLLACKVLNVPYRVLQARKRLLQITAIRHKTVTLPLTGAISLRSVMLPISIMQNAPDLIQYGLKIPEGKFLLSALKMNPRII